MNPNIKINFYIDVSEKILSKSGITTMKFYELFYRRRITKVNNAIYIVFVGFCEKIIFKNKNNNKTYIKFFIHKKFESFLI